MKITNNSKAKRGVRVGGQIVWIAPGSTVEGSPTDKEAERLERYSFIELSGAKAKAETEKPSDPESTDDFDAFSDEDLRAHIESETGDKPHHKAGRAKLLEMARAI